MAGVLLRSGSVKHFLPLGATGNPVYSAASQLRAAMRRQLGQDLADYFAIPKQDEKGEIIDWYSAFEGNVVPWTAATQEERADAKAKLLVAREKLLEKSRALQVAEDSEQQVFGKLLALATRIPSDDHVYLVDGRPVITFWGFSERDAPSDQDVLAGLDTSGGLLRSDEASWLGEAVADSESAAGVADTTSTRSRWWSWPWLLLPLLLLLLLLWLLLFGLRGCGTGWPPQFDLIWPPQHEEPVTDKEKQTDTDKSTADVDLDRDDATTRDRSDDTSTETRGVDGRTVVDGVHRGGVVRHSGTETSEVDSTFDGSRSGRDTVDQDRSDTDTTDTTDRTDTTANDGSDETAAERADTARTEDTDDTATTDDQPETPRDKEGTSGDKGERDAETGDPSKDTASDGKATDEDRPQATTDTNGKTDSGSAANTRGSGKPLVIPRDAARKGSTEFMNGKWGSMTGLQDAAGNPVQLEYEFKGGEGTAKLRRTVGGREQECTAAVRPSFKGSKLVIDQTDDIRCPDGTTFERSSVECTTNPRGQAKCVGKNRNGSEYKVEINKK